MKCQDETTLKIPTTYDLKLCLHIWLRYENNIDDGMDLR